MKIKKISINTGFTIVELLIVIVIIGILATLALVSYTGISKKAVVASLQSDLSGAVGQLKAFQVDKGYYPTAIDCTSTPVADSICLKASPGNSFTDYPYSRPTPQTFTLTNSNGTNIWVITENSSPSAFVPVVIVPVNLAYTGAYQTYVVPAGVSSLILEVWGAQGGEGGNGGYAKGTVSVTPGETLRIYVGGQGIFNNYCNQAANQGAGFNGGGGANCYGMGGGGATDIRRSPYGLADRIIVAGGGGGRGVEGGSGGAGGGLIGQSGFGGTVPNGTGGTQSAGGTVSTGSGSGALGQGGYQLNYYSWAGSGGGGGGYYGGGSGGSPVGGNAAAGGGGSSYVQASATDVVYLQGNRAGNGKATISN